MSLFARARRGLAVSPAIACAPPGQGRWIRASLKQLFLARDVVMEAVSPKLEKEEEATSRAKSTFPGALCWCPTCTQLSVSLSACMGCASDKARVPVDTSHPQQGGTPERPVHETRNVTPCCGPWLCCLRRVAKVYLAMGMGSIVIIC